VSSLILPYEPERVYSFSKNVGRQNIFTITGIEPGSTVALFYDHGKSLEKVDIYSDVGDEVQFVTNCTSPEEQLILRVRKSGFLPFEFSMNNDRSLSIEPTQTRDAMKAWHDENLARDLLDS
jgi:hypothetical protein